MAKCCASLLRYRAMVPLLFTVLLLEHSSRKLHFWFLPIARFESPPGFYFNLAVVMDSLIGAHFGQRPDEP